MNPLTKPSELRGGTHKMYTIPNRRLTWRLRAEAAEARLAQEAETSKRRTRTQTEPTKKA